MLRLLPITVLSAIICLYAGCLGISIGSDGYTAAPAEVKTLCEEFKVALEKQDWEALKALHWSGYEESAEQLQSFFEPKLKDLVRVTDVEVDYYDPLTKDNYLEQYDEDEIPGPKELLDGQVEFYIDGPDSEEGPYLYLWCFLGREEGKLKILGYYERSLE